MVSVWFDETRRSSGDKLDGVYTNSLVLPRFSEPGQWTLSSVSAMDAAGNRKQMDLERVVAVPVSEAQRFYRLAK